MTQLNVTVQRLIDIIGEQVDSLDIASCIKTPSDLKTNEEISRWFDEQKALVDYAVSFALASRFELLKKEAKEKLEALAIITEDDKKLEPSETLYNIYSSDVVALNLKVSRPVSRVDNKKLVTELRKAGVDSTIIDKAVEAATSFNAPAKSYTVTMK